MNCVGTMVFLSFFLLVYFFISTHCLAFTIDDTYISLRYAKNWASGAGLLWNINSPPIEGSSNFIFVVKGLFYQPSDACFKKEFKIISYIKKEPPFL